MKNKKNLDNKTHIESKGKNDKKRNKSENKSNLKEKKNKIAQTIDKMIRDSSMLSSFKLNKNNLEFIRELRKKYLKNILIKKRQKTTLILIEK